MRNEAGEIGFKFMVGGGMGRTPILGSVIREFLPWQHLLTYTEAIMRVYNQYGRRDNKYKARIKILVKAARRRRVRAPGRSGVGRPEGRPGNPDPTRNSTRVAAYFDPPPYASAGGHRSARRRMPDNKAFANWLQRNVKPHKVPGYAAVMLSLKKTGVPPGDATAEQMDFVADLADSYSFGELRVTHEQNLVLADVEQADLFELWQEAKAQRPGDAEHRPADRHHLLPGRRLLLAGQREVDPDRRRHRRALRRPRLPARHRRHRTEHLRLHQRLRPPPRRPHRRARRRQGRQPSGTRCRSAARRATTPRIGKIIGPSFSAPQMPEVVDRLLRSLCARARRGRALRRHGAAPRHRAVQGTCVCHADQRRAASSEKIDYA